MPRKNYIFPDFFATVSGRLPYTPTNDYIFKKLLVKNRKALKAFLASLLHIRISDVKNIEILNPELLPEHIHDKKCILDIHLLLNNSMRINLEMQAISQTSWPNRSVIYLCRTFDNLPAGGDYGQLLPAKQIGILDFTLSPDEPEFFAHYRMVNVKNQKVFNDNIELCVLDLNQINLATEEDKARGIDLWARFFKATTWEDLQMLAHEKKIFADCAQTIYDLLQDEEQRLYMQARVDGQLLWQEKEREVKEAFAKLDAKEAELSQKDAQLSQKDAQLSQKDAEIARLKAQLAALT